MRQLLRRADEGQERFQELQAQLVQGLDLEGQSRLVLNSRLIEWLIGTVRPEDLDRLLGINNVMKLQLQQKLPEADGPRGPRETVPFEIPDELGRRLMDAGLAENAVPHEVIALSTTAGGQAYRDLCLANGVPVPPDGGTSPWIARGVLDNEFISADWQAEVFTFQSASPEGMCIALPRFDASDTIRLLGVICLGKASGNTCFWDNQSGGTQFFPRRGEVVPFSRFGGGADLVANVGGICTECHAGENPFVIHPGTSLGLPALAGLPLFADRWYEPLVKPGWPENPGPLDLPGACALCHTEGGEGRSLPRAVDPAPRLLRHNTAEGELRAPCPPLPEYTPGSLAKDPHPASLRDRCTQPPWSPPLSGRRVTAAAIPGGGLQAFAIGTSDNAVWTNWQDRPFGSWRAWSNELGGTGSDVAVAAIPGGGLEVFVIGSDGATYHRWQDQPFGNWSDWESLGGVGSDVAVAAIPGGGLEVFVIGSDGAVWHRWQNEPFGDWSGWESLEGWGSDVAVAAIPGGGLEVFVIGSDGAVWHRWQNEPFGDWSGWESLEGWGSSVAVEAIPGGGLEVFVTGGNGIVYHRWQNEPFGDWSGWESLEGSGSDVAVTVIPGGGLEVFVTGSDGTVWHRWQEQPFGDWSGWVQLRADT